MPQILRNANDTITVTVDGSNARYPTAVVLPPRGLRSGEADTFSLSPTTNVGRYAWDVNEGADATVAASFPIAAGAALTLPIPPPARTDAEIALQRHVVEVEFTTALAEGETFTITDGTNAATLESDAGNDGVGVSSIELGTNASTAADQAAGFAAAMLGAGYGSGAYIRAQVDAQSTTKVILMGHTNAKNITIGGGTVTSTTTADGVTTTVRDLGTGVITVRDYGRLRPIVYVLSETTSTAISIATAAA